jgi:uncharacterized protein involved in type VI secretion and phage assembly
MVSSRAADHVANMPETTGTVTRIDVDANDATPRSGEAGWTWPPYAPWEPVGAERYGIDEWAPASTVRHPWVRVGRWTLLYRRAA